MRNSQVIYMSIVTTVFIIMIGFWSPHAFVWSLLVIPSLWILHIYPNWKVAFIYPLLLDPIKYPIEAIILDTVDVTEGYLVKLVVATFISNAIWFNTCILKIPPKKVEQT